MKITSSIHPAGIAFAILATGLFLSPKAASAGPAIYGTDQVAAHVAQDVFVRGRLERLSSDAKGKILLDIDGVYPNQKFTVVIPADAAGKFPKLGGLVGKTLLFKGRVSKGPDGDLKMHVTERRQIIPLK